VLRVALSRVLIGVTIGLAGAWAVSAGFSSFVFRVSPTEPAVYFGVAGFLVLVGLLAALVPAIRASRLDPLASLRAE
jgi:ABC-type antimicrobial peptide transport system permease subunit